MTLFIIKLKVKLNLPLFLVNNTTEFNCKTRSATWIVYNLATRWLRSIESNRNTYRYFFELIFNNFRYIFVISAR